MPWRHQFPMIVDNYILYMDSDDTRIPFYEYTQISVPVGVDLDRFQKWFIDVRHTWLEWDQIIRMLLYMADRYSLDENGFQK